tara:strand:+ start:1277 stop:1501 length:225 start_codon:yes stop_codon:yes gene_type:complete
MRGVDFSDSDLYASLFRSSDLQGARFSSSILSKCDFTDAKNYEIHLNHNRVTDAVFSFPEAINLLNGFDIRVKY